MIALLNILVLLASNFLVLSILPHFRIFFIVPLVPLFFIIPLAYFRKGAEPFMLAAFSGILLDLFSAYPFGFFLIFFLAVTLVVRVVFSEGLRTFSFWRFMTLLGLSLVAFYLVQLIYFYFNGADFTVDVFLKIGLGLLVNLVCGILFYAFSSWYFDQMNVFGNYLKRR